ncbi:MAG: BrnA antitoxin family protein [Caldilineaceae bacterium SB0662_bin_9]|uniref:BrnA antitoxin family protein n=1 Tax=Caldilineaceae bacterium SB0662_bin_9 TaxID=2605258 RepID=A0A6B1DRD9_9CHLR|nr:BrnA antitoxin family protein [Caldilineaceae bacterium SB0666_bin_21]MYD89313.1 BrnA antitoxin family protein [Caldilineaceae bacterium SB0662_bin_9]
MPENESSMERDFDPDTAPDLSTGGWPEKLATAPVRRGRPPKARPKVSTTIRLSQDVIDHFRAGGRGWQTRIDQALQDWIKQQHDMA